MPTTRIGRLTAALLLVAVLAIGVVALSACGSGSDTAASSSPSAAASGPITVTDDSGTEVTLGKAAERIVSLAPANTEIAYAVGAGAKMVAGTSYDDYPEEAKALPKIGDFANPNVEKIASYSPDLVLAAGGIQDKLRQQARGARHEGLRRGPPTYDGAITTIENIGKLAGAGDGPGRWLATMTAAEQEVGQGLPADARCDLPRVYQQAADDRRLGHVHRQHGHHRRGENIGAQAGSGSGPSAPRCWSGRPAGLHRRLRLHGTPGDVDCAPASPTSPRSGRSRLRDRRQPVDRPGPRLAEGLKALAGMVRPRRRARSGRAARPGVSPGILLAAGILTVCLMLGLPSARFTVTDRSSVW